jgi:hypothetical protein
MVFSHPDSPAIGGSLNITDALHEIMSEARSKPSRKFHVHWSAKGGVTGHYVIDAASDRDARRETKRYLDARFLGSKWRITWVRDLEEEAAHAKARVEFEAGQK